MKKLMILVLVFAMLAITAMPAMAAEVPVAAATSIDAAGENTELALGSALITYGVQVTATLLITLIGVLGTWLTAKIAKKQQLANIAAATEQVMLAAQTTVGELQQTVVEGLKAAGGGKLTPEQIQALGQELLGKTKAKLCGPALSLLEAAAVDVNALITGASEAWINRIKAAT